MRMVMEESGDSIDPVGGGGMEAACTWVKEKGSGEIVDKGGGGDFGGSVKDSREGGKRRQGV